MKRWAWHCPFCQAFFTFARPDPDSVDLVVEAHFIDHVDEIVQEVADAAR